MASSDDNPLPTRDSSTNSVRKYDEVISRASQLQVRRLVLLELPSRIKTMKKLYMAKKTRFVLGRKMSDNENNFERVEFFRGRAAVDLSYLLCGSAC